MNSPFFILNEEHFTFHLQYKHSGTFANRKYEEQKMRDPILVTLLKMRPHYSQSTRENATPSSGTSPLASYKEELIVPCENSEKILRKRFHLSGDTIAFLLQFQKLQVELDLS